MKPFVSALPSLYISHGSPMTVLNPGLTGQRLAELAAALPRPKAIVVASAHFPDALFQIRCPAPGSASVAERVHDLLTAAGLPASLDPARGFDHGVWAPLTMLYPDADIPVVPIAIQPQLGPAHHVALGRALAPLRQEGVFVIGSGSITHNLRDSRSGYGEHRQAPYVEPFVSWVEQRLAADDVDSLTDYRRQAPFAERAHPTDEHLLPLHVAMGAVGGAVLGAHRIDARVDMGFLSMDIYRFDGDLAPKVTV